MSTPIQEKEQYSFPAFAPNAPNSNQNAQNDRRSSDEDGTLQGQENDEIDRNHLRVTTSYVDGPDYIDRDNRSPMSLSQQKTIHGGKIRRRVRLLWTGKEDLMTQ